MSNDGTLTLEEVFLFQLVLKSHRPTDFIQLDTTLKILMNILLLVIKSTHHLRTDFQVFITTWNGLFIQLAERFNRNTEMAAQLLWSVQLCTLVYWKSISTLTLNQARIFPAPNCFEFLNSFMIQTWAQMQMPKPPPTPLSTGLVPIPPDPASTTPTHVPTTESSPAPTPAALRKINSNINSEIRTLMEGRNDLHIRLLFSSTVRPPLKDSNNNLCCAYQLKGRCFTNLSCASNHRGLSEMSAVRLRDFLHEHIVRLDVGHRQNPSPS